MHAVNNYGSVLQTLATEKIFRDLNCDIETLDYIQDNLQLNSIYKIIKNGGPGWKIKLKQILYLFLKRKKQIDSLDEFRRKFLHMSKRRYMSTKELYEFPPIADIYCTGSDQTWNTLLHGVSPAYFLDFVPKNKKKIAFSASFGIEKIPNSQKKEVKKLLSKYTSISVREISGLQILHNLGIHDAQLVLDPTLVVDYDFWEKISAERQYMKEYILVYQLNASTFFSDFVNRFAKEKGYKIILVRSRNNTQIKNCIYMGMPKPEVVLSLFKFSKYVITDSFHATVFSLIFHRDFIDILPPYFSSRINSLLSLTGLTNRIVTDIDDYNCCNMPIDWKSVDKVICSERNKTMSFLQKAVLI